MKKILIFLCGILFSCNTLALEFTNKKEYNIRKKYISNTPKIYNFFLFCAHIVMNLKKHIMLET